MPQGPDQPASLRASQPARQAGRVESTREVKECDPRPFHACYVSH